VRAACVTVVRACGVRAVVRACGVRAVGVGGWASSVRGIESIGQHDVSWVVILCDSTGR
jgi:hypothetical protein